MPPSPAPTRPAPTWSVVATVREPLPLVLAFACHHLAVGAQTVHLFFDDPDDPVADVLGRIKGVDVIRCDADHWRHLSGRPRPGLQTKRQTLNANLVMHSGRTDWLLHADADEFLWAPDGVATDLPSTADWLSIPNLERCWTAPAPGLFDGAFRAPLQAAPRPEDIYGPTASFLSAGLGGHCGGKPLARTSSEGFLAIHKVKQGEGGATLPHTTAKGARILHFDGLTPRHWALKTLRYAAQPGALGALLNGARRRAITRILAADDILAETLALHDEMFRLSIVQSALLSNAGALTDMPLDLAGAIRTHAPGVHADLSAHGVDEQHEDELQRLVANLSHQPH